MFISVLSMLYVTRRNFLIDVIPSRGKGELRNLTFELTGDLRRAGFGLGFV